MEKNKNHNDKFEKLDNKTELLWKKTSDEVTINRSAGSGSTFNKILVAESKREKKVR